MSEFHKCVAEMELDTKVDVYLVGGGIISGDLSETPDPKEVMVVFQPRVHVGSNNFERRWVYINVNHIAAVSLGAG